MLIEAIRTAIDPPPEQLRYVGYCLTHACDKGCNYCRVPKRQVKMMDERTRYKVITAAKSLSGPSAIFSTYGGEPTLYPDVLLETSELASRLGFFPTMVTNGHRLSPELVKELAKVGMRQISISIDGEHGDTSIDSIRSALDAMRRNRVVGVVNSVLTRDINVDEFIAQQETIVREGYYANPTICSPRVRNGDFSNASDEMVPTPEQVQRFTIWADKRRSTGLVSTGIGYTNALMKLAIPNAGALSHIQRWHCENNLRGKGGGRGFLNIDSDGTYGICQEHPREC